MRATVVALNPVSLGTGVTGPELPPDNFSGGEYTLGQTLPPELAS